MNCSIIGLKGVRFACFGGGFEVGVGGREELESGSKTRGASRVGSTTKQGVLALSGALESFLPLLFDIAGRGLTPVGSN